MRRADRLLQILQILRRQRGPIAASRIAEELEVSLRTLYRDMVALEASGVPVRGEAGVGYVLEDGYDMPPLMFSALELEAIMLGARLVDGRADDALARAAKDAIAKIASVVPAPLRSHLVETPLYAPHYQRETRTVGPLEALREALRDERQVDITYRDLKGQMSKRTVWPVQISFFRDAVLLVCWCTLREAFRSFRVDRIEVHSIGPERVPKPRRTLFAQWLKQRDMALQEASARIESPLTVRGI
ncbi:MAG: YafY family protein [Pseudomonadota bacterium]